MRLFALPIVVLAWALVVAAFGSTRGVVVGGLVVLSAVLFDHIREEIRIFRD